MTELVGEGYGRTVAFRGPEEVLGPVRALLPFWWRDSHGEPERVIDLAASDDPGLAVRFVERWVGERARGFVFVHAAVVAVDGLAVLLPGRSTSGKTTLCAALLRLGATYLSDEYAVLTADGLVHPYPRALRVRGDDGRVHVAAGALGAHTATGPVAVGVVARLGYRPDAGWRVVDETRGHAVLGLLDNALAARTRSEEVLDSAGLAVQEARCVSGSRGPAEEAGAELLRLVESVRRR